MTKSNTNVLIRFPDELLEQVEEYRHEKRVPSRHQAILDLILKGLEKEAVK